MPVAGKLCVKRGKKSIKIFIHTGAWLVKGTEPAANGRKKNGQLRAQREEIDHDQIGVRIELDSRRKGLPRKMFSPKVKKPGAVQEEQLALRQKGLWFRNGDERLTGG